MKAAAQRQMRKINAAPYPFIKALSKIGRIFPDIASVNRLRTCFALSGSDNKDRINPCCSGGKFNAAPGQASIERYTFAMLEYDTRKREADRASQILESPKRPGCRSGELLR